MGVRRFDETQFVLAPLGGICSLVVLVEELNPVHDLVGGLVPMRMPLPLWDSDEPSKKSGDHETPVSSINLGTALQLAEDHSAPQNCKVVTEQKGPKNLAIGVETFDLGRNLIIQGSGVNHPAIILGIIFISLLETPRLTNKS